MKSRGKALNDMPPEAAFLRAAVCLDLTHTEPCHFPDLAPSPPGCITLSSHETTNFRRNDVA